MKNEENYWEQFMTSGRISDYLSYVEKREEDKLRDVALGEAFYAGFLCSDRDGDKPDACR